MATKSKTAISRATAGTLIGKRPQLEIPRSILEELSKDVRVILPDETRGIFPLPIDLLKNEVFLKKILADKKLQQNFEIAIISKTR